MLQLEEEEGEEGIKVIMEKATNYESQPKVVEGSKMFTKATSVNRKYSEEEKKLLNSYNSMDYMPPHSQVSKDLDSPHIRNRNRKRRKWPKLLSLQVYTSWLAEQPDQLAWERWLMMAIIGIATGITGFLLHQIIEVIADCKWEFAKSFLLEGDLLLSWLTASAYSLGLVLLSTASVVLLSPSAAGSGTPELISFLNGTMIKQFFNIETFLVKFGSCALAVGAGLPVGPEGPMIHLGSLIGALLSQFQTKRLTTWVPWFNRSPG